MTGIVTLKNNRQFKEVLNKGHKIVTKGLVVVGIPRKALSFCSILSEAYPPTTLHVGYITSRKLGSAVHRNRIRRRLKEITHDIFKREKSPFDLDCVYVFIGRKSAEERAYDLLKKDMVYALHEVKRAHATEKK